MKSCMKNTEDLNHAYSNQGPPRLDAFWILYVAQVDPNLTNVYKQELTGELTSTNLDQTPLNLDTYWRLSVRMS